MNHKAQFSLLAKLIIIVIVFVVIGVIVVYGGYQFAIEAGENLTQITIPFNLRALKIAFSNSCFAV